MATGEIIPTTIDAAGFRADDAAKGPAMWEALGWEALAASSLIIGAVLGVALRWHQGWIGVVLGFGAGALISSVSRTCQ